MSYLVCENRNKNYFERSALAGSRSGFQKKLNERGMFLAVTKKTTVFRDADFEKYSGDPGEWETYLEKIRSVFTVNHMGEGSNDGLLRELYTIRGEMFGDRPYRALWEKEYSPSPVTGIDQSELTGKLFDKNTLVFFLSSPEYAPDFIRDVKRAANEGKKIYSLVFKDDPVLPREETVKKLVDGTRFVPLCLEDQKGVCDLSSVPYEKELARAVDENDAALISYGEDALFSARSLRLPASVTLKPVGLLARAMTNLFTRPAKSVIYVPAGFDITPYVSLQRPTELTYYHIAAIAEKNGEKAYSMSPEEAAEAAPDLFFHFYDDHIPPVRENAKFNGSDLYSAREKYLQDKLASLPGVTPIHACFDKSDFSLKKAEWNAKEYQNDLLVDGAIVSPETKADVLTFDGKAVSPREYFFDKKGNSRYLITNYTYFFTPKLITIYNDLRKDRPKEKIGAFTGTVGYSRFRDKNGKIHDTIPPYAKPAVAFGKNGFCGFHYKAGGGQVTIENEVFRWEDGNVNVQSGDVTLYTPMLSVKDEDRDPSSYVLCVGEGALNVSIVGEEILVIRRGDVTLPCIGAVLSLKGGAAKRLEVLLSEPDGDGYYPVNGLELSIKMDPAKGFTQEEWDGLYWIFGGGIELINGKDELTEENCLERFRKDGWLTPLSRQTQETDQHVISLQPRTGLGITEKGELAVLVYSGRTEVSSGASYPEMCRAAKLLIPDIEKFYSFDGGGSSVFGLLEGCVFSEINVPAPSNESVAGMGRQISSFLVIDIDG